jgi:hypothetical protein
VFNYRGHGGAQSRASYYGPLQHFKSSAPLGVFGDIVKLAVVIAYILSRDHVWEVRRGNAHYILHSADMVPRTESHTCFTSAGTTRSWCGSAGQIGSKGQELKWVDTVLV